MALTCCIHLHNVHWKIRENQSFNHAYPSFFGEPKLSQVCGSIGTPNRRLSHHWSGEWLEHPCFFPTEIARPSFTTSTNWYSTSSDAIFEQCPHCLGLNIIYIYIVIIYIYSFKSKNNCNKRWKHVYVYIYIHEQYHVYIYICCVYECIYIYTSDIFNHFSTSEVGVWAPHCCLLSSSSSSTWRAVNMMTSPSNMVILAGIYIWFMIAKLVDITPITMVYDTYTIVNGVYKPLIYNWGATL